MTEWINAKARLPEAMEYVLVCKRTKAGVRDVDKGYYLHDSRRWVHRGTAKVTHWMPLPDLPEEENDD